MLVIVDHPVRQVRPDRVLGMSPEPNLDRIYASHPDHLAVGRATLAAAYPAAHVTQTAHRDGLADMVRAWAAATAAAVGLPEGRYAEAFRRVDTR